MERQGILGERQYAENYPQGMQIVAENAYETRLRWLFVANCLIRPLLLVDRNLKFPPLESIKHVSFFCGSGSGKQ